MFPKRGRIIFRDFLRDKFWREDGNNGESFREQNEERNYINT